MSSDEVIEYCRQRERYLSMQRATAEERAETADAMRTIGGLLTESMVRNDVRCVRIASNESGVQYIRVVPQRRRAKQLKNIDDVLTLLDGIGSEVVDVPFEQLPKALTQVVQERARQQGGTVPPRVQVTQRVGVREQVTEVDQAPREVEQLSKQMKTTHTERKQLREKMQPVRKEMARCERTIAESGRVDDPVLVQMRTADNAIVPPRVLSVCTQEYVKKKNIYGLRHVCGYVRDAVSGLGARDDDFESKLKEEVQRVIEDVQRRPEERGTKVRVRRGPKAPHTTS